MYDKYNIENYELIMKTSPTVGELIKKEFERQSNNVELIASENYCSDAVMAACGSCLVWKYAEGYPAPPVERYSGNKGRYYGGTEFVDQIEEYCCDVWRKVFNTDYHVNVQPHSGSQANFAAYKSVLEPGDTILSFDLDHGGHLTHGSSVNFSGKLYNMVFYDVDENGYIDMDNVRKLAHECQPKLILAGASAYSRILDFETFGEIAKEVGAYFMVDMAHIAGLVAGGVHPSPFGIADIITTTTHKTLRGPRGGLIFAKKELAKKVDSAVFPYAQGGPLEHIIAAKAVCAEEALRPEFKDYAKKVVENCAALCDEFLKLGYKVVTGGTDNHLLLVDLRPLGISGKEAEDELDAAGVTCNKNAIPNDTSSRSVTGGIRLGTAALTTRGLIPSDMEMIAEAIKLVVSDRTDAAKAHAKDMITELTERYPLYENVE